MDFLLYHYQSLSKFKRGQISTITAIENSATYNSWSDFYTTLQTIIKFESQGISGIWINYLNPDMGTNPNDHADHITTGTSYSGHDNYLGFKTSAYLLATASVMHKRTYHQRICSGKPECLQRMRKLYMIVVVIARCKKVFLHISDGV
ncbi:MAG: hypothetical protein WKG06_15785 [Segetibacter sp.]